MLCYSQFKIILCHPIIKIYCGRLDFYILSSLVHMTTSQPRVQVIIESPETFMRQTSGFPWKIWHSLRDQFLWPIKSSADPVASNLRTVLLLLFGILALFTVFVILRKLASFLSNLWVESQPNQWLLVIRNGNLIKAGVGLKTLIGPWDSVVKFPSKVQRIQFNAMNVTQQMQGVKINGVTFWSVHREGDGPFKCYKYMQGGDANANVKTMCQSVLRNMIANSKLDDVLKKRDLMKENMNKQIQPSLKGWGIWLQSVQITQVFICSRTLFQELQTQFRNETKFKAQKSQLQAQQKIDQQKQRSELKMAQLRQQNQTKKDQQSLAQELQRLKQKSKYDEEQNKFKMENLQRCNKLELQKLRINNEQDQEKLKNALKIQNQRDKFEEQKVKRKIQLDSLYKNQALQKYSIDTMERIYQNLGIKEVKINQFVSNQQSDLSRILPTLGLLNSLPANK